ncbi:MAG: serine/threonine-protein phosphatase 6 regulatory ankyrin repeat subunit B-like [Rickettsiaceae bacterium]|jgi:ankyrin repeat protein|nr:serine/threonine-protein phosphatase 6 regulatory ankyrin repeat subunit B-like [Rickettsiaceae bacterium]
MKTKAYDLNSIDDAATKKQRTADGSVPTAITQPQNQGNTLDAITSSQNVQNVDLDIFSPDPNDFAIDDLLYNIEPEYQYYEERFARAVLYGDVETIRYFLEKNINIESLVPVYQGDLGEGAALMVAAMTDIPNKMEVVKLLLEWNANPNVDFKHVYNINGVHYEHNEPLLSLLYRKGADQEIIDLIISNSKHEIVYNASKSSATPYGLYEAVSSGYLGQIIFCFKNGVDINAKLGEEATALHIAAKEGHADIAALLIDLGADLEARSEVDDTPLNLAVEYGHADIATLLINRGADVNAKDCVNSTPLHSAAICGDTSIAALLIDRGACLEEKGGDRCYTPLQTAFERGNTSIAALLIERGADVNAKTENGANLLHIAALSGKKDAVILGIKNRLDVNAKDNDEETPIIYFICRGNFDADVLKLLLVAGAVVTENELNDAITEFAPEDVATIQSVFMNEFLVKNKDPESDEVVISLKPEFRINYNDRYNRQLANRAGDVAYKIVSEKTTSPFSLLPKELVQEIFQHLSENDMAAFLSVAETPVPQELTIEATRMPYLCEVAHSPVLDKLDKAEKTFTAALEKSRAAWLERA